MAVCSHGTYDSQVRFATNQPKENPDTPLRERPDRTFFRKFVNREMHFPAEPGFPDGAEFEIWSFADESSGRSLPSPLLRCTEGEVVHVKVQPSRGPHTIHWHGIEPDPHNDGVGHTSFEVTGDYTYQWRPRPGEPGDPRVGSAGTYFYHCHVNTPLHVQMGMFGPLIVDPVAHPDFPTSPGGRRAFVDGPEYDVETETILAPYSVDPRWHRLSHSAGLSGDDAGMHRFDPEHYYLLGGQIAAGQPPDAVWTLDEIRARPRDSQGLPTLLRVNNANYIPTRLRFTWDQEGRRPLDEAAEVIAHDGRAFRDTSSATGPSRPLGEVGRPILTDRLTFGAAERFDVLLRPPGPGTYWLHVDWFHWAPQVSRQPMATRSVPLVCEDRP